MAGVRRAVTGSSRHAGQLCLIRRGVRWGWRMLAPSTPSGTWPGGGRERGGWGWPGQGWVCASARTVFPPDGSPSESLRDPTTLGPDHGGSTGFPALSRSLHSQARRAGVFGRATVTEEGVLPSRLLLPETWNPCRIPKACFHMACCAHFSSSNVSFLANSRKHRWS